MGLWGQRDDQIYLCDFAFYFPNPEIGRILSPTHRLVEGITEINHCANYLAHDKPNECSMLLLSIISPCSNAVLDFTVMHT